ncbi:hypothetical protein LLG96_16030 [bacterium]|nr:hypothetical protein [bacterium]
MERNFDDLYEILDDMNARIEEIVNEHNDPEIIDMIISRLQQKAQEFIYDFQVEIEKLETMNVEL